MPRRSRKTESISLEPLLTPTMERLLELGWIDKFAFTDDGRFSVGWTEKGRERAGWVRQLDEEFPLASHEAALLRVIVAKLAKD
jgi:hypothetical protein